MQILRRIFGSSFSLIVVINLLNKEYSVPASGYDWVAFGILESPAIDIACKWISGDRNKIQWNKI